MNRSVTSLINSIPAWFILALALVNLIKFAFCGYVLLVNPAGLYATLARDGFSPDVTTSAMYAWAGFSLVFLCFAIYQRAQHGGWRGP